MKAKIIRRELVLASVVMVSGMIIGLTCRAQKLYRDYGIASNAMLRTLLIRIT